MNSPPTHGRKVETAGPQFVLPEEAVHEDFHRGLKDVISR